MFAGATTHLICARYALGTVGDHEFVVGQVIQAIIGTGAPPLLHHQGQFTRPARRRSVAERPRLGTGDGGAVTRVALLATAAYPVRVSDDSVPIALTPGGERSLYM
jgi:hypothetical protein